MKWAIVAGQGPYEIEKIIDEAGGLVQLREGGTWFIGDGNGPVYLFDTKEEAEEFKENMRVPWPVVM